MNKYWTKNTGLQYKGVKYNIGPTPDNVVLNLYNHQSYVITPLWNVIGVINGTISDEVVVVGNHRDAWIAGGAGDPNSGSAVLNEVIRSFGKALERGWKPLRTIVFASVSKMVGFLFSLRILSADYSYLLCSFLLLPPSREGEY